MRSDLRVSFSLPIWRLVVRKLCPASISAPRNPLEMFVRLFVDYRIVLIHRKLQQVIAINAEFWLCYFHIYDDLHKRSTRQIAHNEELKLLLRVTCVRWFALYAFVCACVHVYVRGSERASSYKLYCCFQPSASCILKYSEPLHMPRPKDRQFVVTD